MHVRLPCLCLFLPVCQCAREVLESLALLSMVPFCFSAAFSLRFRMFLPFVKLIRVLLLNLKKCGDGLDNVLLCKLRNLAGRERRCALLQRRAAVCLCPQTDAYVHTHIHTD